MGYIILYRLSYYRDWSGSHAATHAEAVRKRDIMEYLLGFVAIIREAKA